MRLRTTLAAVAALATAAVALPAALPSGLPSADAAGTHRRIVWHSWTSQKQLAEGTSNGVVVQGGALRFGTPAGTSGQYDKATWVSPWVDTSFDLTELVASYSGTTPGDSWVKIQVRGHTSSQTSSWDTLARWALDDTQLRRTSLGSQPDDLDRVAYDTWLTGGVSGWQLRVTLLRRTGTAKVPTLSGVGAMVSRLPDVSSVRTSTPGAAPSALGTVLPVPRYSQMEHVNEYPQYDGGGEAWCSPTSTSMVLGYYHALPPASEYAWVDHNHPDRFVAEVARMTYDRGLGGTGNWPFNTAYAASRLDGGGSFVTRLHSLRDAERFIAAGIPLVVSVTFSAGQLDGAPISSTDGHLLVIVGFRANGDVVVNDPAASANSGVRRTYDRAQFEDAWLKRYPSGSSMRGSGGVAYVIHDRTHPLPAPGSANNW